MDAMCLAQPLQRALGCVMILESVVDLIPTVLTRFLRDPIWAIIWAFYSMLSLMTHGFSA